MVSSRNYYSTYSTTTLIMQIRRVYLFLTFFTYYLAKADDSMVPILMFDFNVTTTTVDPAIFVIRKQECGAEFRCPKNCTIQWHGACPSECICIEPRPCPDPNCSKSPEAACVIYTLANGCQKCACRSPYTIIAYKRGKTEPQPTTITTTTTPTTTTAPTVATDAPWMTEASEEPMVNHNHHDHNSHNSGHSNNGSHATLRPPAPVSIGRPGIQLQPLPPSMREDFLKCNIELKREIMSNFGTMDLELAEIGRLSASTYLFPPLFAFTKFELKKRCHAYQAAYTRTSFQAKRNCFSDYDVYIRTYYAYSYTCSWGQESQQFESHFDCLQSLKFNPEVNRCQLNFKPPANIHDRSKACRVHNEVLGCIHATVLRTCGWDGWEVLFDYLSVNVKSYSRNCRLKRINRPPSRTGHNIGQ